MQIFISVSSQDDPYAADRRRAKGPEADKLRAKKKELSPKLNGVKRRMETAEKNKDRKALRTLMKEYKKLSDQVDNINDRLADIGHDAKFEKHNKRIADRAKRKKA